MGWRLAKSLEVLRKQVNDLVPGRDKSSDGSIGDEGHSARISDHNPNDAGVVCAIDITHNPARGFDSYAFAEMLRASRDPRIKYIISNRKIANSTSVTKGGKKYSPWDWSPYSGANPHDHHVHISVKSDAGHYDDASPWRIDLKPDTTPAPTEPVAVVMPVLRRGSSGRDVDRLQILLDKVGKDIKVDGNFGPATETAVKEFQAHAGLVADGIVGGYTWRALEAA